MSQSAPSKSPAPVYDIYAYYARQILAKDIDDLKSSIPTTPPLPTVPSLDSRSEGIVQSASIQSASVQRAFLQSNVPAELPTIGILGAGPAGPAGLYTALMLDDLGIPYHIHEARDRVGGRLFTYKFPGDSGSDPNYNYYDVGAMRFPKIAPMARLFHLFDYKPLNPEEDPLNKRLTPYIFGKKT